MTTTGRGGHGSGLNPESANHQLVLGLARLLELPPRWRVSAPAGAYLQALAPYQNEHWRRVYSRIEQIVTPGGPSEFLPPGLAGLFLDTIQVTVLRGGGRINVIPGQAAASIDIRMLPDTDGDELLETIRRTLGNGFRVRVLVTSPSADPSPASGRFYDAVQRTLAETDAPVVPALVSGFTDSRFFRERGIPAYGLSPFALGPDDLRGIHNPDERIPLAELDLGRERMIRIVEAYAAPR
ncbi:MAG TPA: M20/M25/M40 family metallo-hydrolase [Thermoanaerobaculia bacterium]|nr:M20/M25/M40 family metallo-hydrolase [Thermoanaerobaculia bacterium]